MTSSLQYNIALTQLRGIGPILAKNLLAHFGSVKAIFSENAIALSKTMGIGTVLAKEIVDSRQQALDIAQKELDFIQKHNITPLFFTDKQYPFRLKECIDAPMVLFSKGNVDLNSGKFVAVVGTRKITHYGQKLCEEFVEQLAANHPDITFVSGLAYGVDICAHKKSVEMNVPNVGVVAHSLDRIYPSAHCNVAKKIVENGAIVSEYLSGTKPDATNFVQRNRIIAGMCDAVLIVESPQKGGALITAEFANNYNRDVFAFPGRVGDVYSEGCNQLIIKNKAVLIQSATDVENFMGWEKDCEKTAIQPKICFNELSIDEQKVVTLLTKEKELHINTIAIRTSMPISSLSSLLIEMEFRGLIRCFPGNKYQLT